MSITDKSVFHLL